MDFGFRDGSCLRPPGNPALSWRNALVKYPFFVASDYPLQKRVLGELPEEIVAVIDTSLKLSIR